MSAERSPRQAWPPRAPDARTHSLNLAIASRIREQFAHLRHHTYLLIYTQVHSRLCVRCQALCALLSVSLVGLML